VVYGNSVKQMENKNVVDAFKAFEIKNLQKVSGGVLRYTQSGGGTNSLGTTYADFELSTGGHKCGVPDGAFPQTYKGPDISTQMVASPNDGCGSYSISAGAN